MSHINAVTAVLDEGAVFVFLNLKIDPDFEIENKTNLVPSCTIYIHKSTIHLANKDKVKMESEYQLDGNMHTIS